MTPQLYIVYDGITLDFQSGGYEVVGGFFPATPDDGVESISEQFDIRISFTSKSDFNAKKEAIRLAFEHAKAHKDDILAAYFYYDIDDTGDAWMSKLLNGQIIYQGSLEGTWRHSQVRATIILEHKPYWDAKDEIQVPLTNGNGTNNTAGLNIFSCGDGTGSSPNKHHNYADVAAADVLGDLPGPTRLEITNTFVTNRLGNVWIGQNWIDPDNLAHIIEGESSTIGTEKDGTGTCSNDHYMEASLASGAEADLFEWTLADSLLDACKGMYYKLLGRFTLGVSYLIKFRIKLNYNDLPIWQSGQFYLDQHTTLTIQDLITLRLPPWLVGQTGLAGLTMILTGQQSTGAPLNVWLDFLQVTAVDGWRLLSEVAYGVDQNQRLIDDGFLGNIYVDDGAGDNKAGVYVGYGSSITLYPGKKQRLYFLMHSNVMLTAEVARTISIKLFYRPRRKTL